MNPPEDLTPYAQLVNTTRRYGSVEALSNVSLTVHRGEVVALLGPNGAGKTTAVNLMLGLLRPDSGTARLFGGAPRDAANITRVGVMLQASGVPETLKVRELVDQFSSYYPEPLPVARTVELVGLGGLEDRLFGKLSGGQRQRLLFALALCGNPDLLFLDEPTVGLDVEARQSFWRIVRRLASEGRSILLTTHYLEEAEALADRVIVLDEGRVITEGETAEIRRLTSTSRISAITSLPEEQIAGWPEVHSLSVEAAAGNAAGGALRVEIVTPEAETVTLRLLRADPALTGLEVRQGTLEDAFLTLTGKTPDTGSADHRPAPRDESPAAVA